MKLIIIAGFLGSGKTTLLLQIARRLSRASRKVAIIENEMGEIGIDGDYLDLKGLHVKELYGGCICCTLSSGLIETLEQLEQNYKPDHVILEATGIARPGDIKANLRNFSSRADDIRIITVLDAVRWEMLVEMMEPLIAEQIQAAHVVFINKIDPVGSEAVNRIIQNVAQMNPQAKITAISVEGKSQMKQLMDDLL